MARRRLRPDEWIGYCSRCEDDTTLGVLKADGRWTLRQLFGAWEDCDFEISCRRCDGRWPAQLRGGETLSVSEWLDELRGGREPSASPERGTV